MTDRWSEVLIAARDLAATLPRETVAALAAQLAHIGSGADARLDSLVSTVATAAGREAAAKLVQAWRRDAPDLPGVALAMGIGAAAETDEAWRGRQAIEVVWTGPTPRGVALRRTDQALLELIRLARRQVTLVSFAAYKVPDVAQALVDASRRGVGIRLIMETPQASEGAVTFAGFDALSGAFSGSCERYVWPLAERTRDANGRPGALHAKCALADTHAAFVSSANLTEYALGLNMELGLFISGGDVPPKIAALIDGLIAERKLAPTAFRQSRVKGIDVG